MMTSVTKCYPFFFSTSCVFIFAKNENMNFSFFIRKIGFQFVDENFSKMERIFSKIFHSIGEQKIDLRKEKYVFFSSLLDLRRFKMSLFFPSFNFLQRFAPILGKLVSQRRRSHFQTNCANFGQKLAKHHSRGIAILDEIFSCNE